jgi:lysyl-tRNA synthetase class 2
MDHKDEAKAQAAAAQDGEKKLYLDEVTGEMVSKNELKTRKKLREKEEAKKKKEEEKAAKQPPATAGKAKAPEEILDPTQYTNNRKQFVQKLRDDGNNPYPHKFDRTHRIDEFNKFFEPICVEKGVFLEDQKIAVTGRVISIRAAGPKLVFIDLTGDDHKVQIMATAQNYEADFE